MARQLASSEQNSNNNFVQLFPEMWYLDTKCASNRVRRGQKVFWSHWFLCIYAVDQNNRGEKDQSITVKEKQWCGWMNMDKSVNSFAAFLFCIWSRRYTRSSLSGKMTHASNTTNQSWASLFLLGMINNHWPWKDACSAYRIQKRLCQRCYCCGWLLPLRKCIMLSRNRMISCVRHFLVKPFVLSHGKKYL